MFTAITFDKREKTLYHELKHTLWIQSQMGFTEPIVKRSFYISSHDSLSRMKNTTRVDCLTIQSTIFNYVGLSDAYSNLNQTENERAKRKGENK